MRFDGNRAWNDAVHAVSANREVLLVLAGVFFFLPDMVRTLILSKIQTEVATNLIVATDVPGKAAAFQQMMRPYARIAPYVIVIMLVQVLGYMAMLALLTDIRRPTVREAMAIGARSLPALIGTILIFSLGYVLASLPMGLVLMACIAGLGPQLGTAIGVTIALVVVLLMVTRLSLTLPVIVIEGLHRPFAALQRSWRMTSGSTLRLLGFFMMLAIAYIVISIALTALVNLLAAVTGTGAGFILVAGGVVGAIGAVASMVLIAILAAIHRQLSGPWRGAIGETFN